MVGLTPGSQIAADSTSFSIIQHDKEPLIPTAQQQSTDLRYLPRIWCLNCEEKSIRKKLTTLRNVSENQPFKSHTLLKHNELKQNAVLQCFLVFARITYKTDCWGM